MRSRFTAKIFLLNKKFVLPIHNIKYIINNSNIINVKNYKEISAYIKSEIYKFYMLHNYENLRGLSLIKFLG